uniref:Uncharacterized protein n=1 Tax=Amphimedon queenslandica TaxID=400682 RepID=A0A1X7U3D4_AMPQE
METLLIIVAPPIITHIYAFDVLQLQEIYNHPSKLKEEDRQTTLDSLIKTPAKKYDPKTITQISGNDALVEFIAEDSSFCC